MNIRDASPHDAAQVISLWERCELTRPWNDPTADFALALKSLSSTILIAEMDDDVVGTVMVGFDGHRGWVYYLATDPKHRNEAIGKSLLSASEDWLIAKGCRKVELMVRDGNDAVGFYEHLGWEQQAVLVFGRWLDRAEK